MRCFHQSFLVGIVSLAAAVVCAAAAMADDLLVLASNGTCDYQIVIPDDTSDPVLDGSLKNIGLLLQTAFKKSGFEVPVIKEKDKAIDKPGIYLGNTVFARDHGVDVSKLKGWSYVWKTVGPDLIIAGRDHAPPISERHEITNYYRLATLKGVADFMRDYLGTRFLYVDGNQLPTGQSKGVRDWNLATAAVEFQKNPTIQIPADLDLVKTPWIGYHMRNRRCYIYDVANNFFPMVDVADMAHTYDKAIPSKLYREDHPEYFALIGGTRSKVHYCVANPEFQELFYLWTRSWLDKGCVLTSVLHQDGFQGCQCEYCKTMYDTGPSEWSEKLWLFQKDVAERLKKEHPDKKVLIYVYTVTRTPPKSYDAFPDNVVIGMQGTVPDLENIKEWREKFDIPGGFACGLHNWCNHLITRYTPASTPLFLAKQVRDFHENKVQGIRRDGSGCAFGLEGPAYYVFGRMFDDVDNLRAKDLMFEFCSAAFGEGAPNMIRFYDKLHHAIELYPEYLGTHRHGWSYKDIYGRGHKHLSDPFRMFGFLYTPTILKNMEKDLIAAEAKAKSPEAKARLELVRREFDYLKALVKVVHLYQAYQAMPDKASRDRLLDAIDARNALISSYYSYMASRDGGERKYDQAKPIPGFNYTLFPPSGHNYKHLRLAYNRYGEPMADTCFNWDTEKKRQAPLPSAKKLIVNMTPKPPRIDSPVWENTKPVKIVDPANQKKIGQTSLRALYDDQNLYLQAESELKGNTKSLAVGPDGNLEKTESLDVYVAPQPGRDLFFRFKVGVDANSKYDAANGLITDKMNLLYARDDKSWNGEWTYQTTFDPNNGRWMALLTIPFKTLDVEPPKSGTNWRGNFGRVGILANNKPLKTVWSGETMGDKDGFSDVAFEGPPGIDAATFAARKKLKERRIKHYAKTFEIPDDWKVLPNPLPNPLGPWRFRADPLEKGVAENWFDPSLDESKWETVSVPSFWAEHGPNHRGIAWYRTTFDVPADWMGKPIRLSFGSVDEEAWVYLNGQMVGEHNAQSAKTPIDTLWESPFTFDVNPDNVNYGGKNTLSVRVQNTKGNGGVWRPVLVNAVE